jgi:hypothetical protein
MGTIEDRLHALSTTPAPAPPALDDLRGRSRARRRHRASAVAGTLAALVALAVLAWSTVADTDGSPNVVAGPTADQRAGDVCEGVTFTPPPGPGGSGPVDDPVLLACQALQYYGNDEPPEAVRLGPVDTATFLDWQRQHTGGGGPVNGPVLPDTVTVLLVRTSGGELWSPRTPASSSAELRGDTVYVVFTEGLSPGAVSSNGTGTWSEIVASPWAQELEEIDVG